MASPPVSVSLLKATRALSVVSDDQRWRIVGAVVVRLVLIGLLVALPRLLDGDDPPPTGGVFYENCAAARAAGAAPLRRGEPGYRSALDRDDDGIACEV